MLLQLDGEGPLYGQAYRALRQAVLEGRLRPGERLPATRSLASEARLSRNTILQAYEQLADEGYVVTRTGSGTYVATTLPEERVAAVQQDQPAPGDAFDAEQKPPPLDPNSLPLSTHASRMVEQVPRGEVSWSIPRRHLPYDFRYGEPSYGDLPLETWCRLLGRRARRASVARLAYNGPKGAPELREALAGYLRKSRGVTCTPEQVLITHGTQQAIDLVARVLVDAGDRVAVEEPHYTGFSLVLGAYGAEMVPLNVDEHGACVEALDDLGPLRGICVTPSHQFPIGGVLPLERRLSLLDWAERNRSFILEDDYDGEYRYENRPVPSLQGLDRADRVLYAGSASKLLFPSLRIGWLVVPESLVRPFALAKAYTDTGSANLEQLVLADFIVGGHLERHVRRSRVRNGARREALQAAIDEFLGSEAKLAGTRAGLHGVLWIPDLPATREAELRTRCAQEGVGIYPLGFYYQKPPAHAGFLLGYGALREEDIREGIRRMAICLADL